MKKAKILIAEDQVMIAKTIESELMTSGYEVLATVFSSEDAVCEAGKNKPDLIMMDIKLSGEMDGIQAAEQIRTKYDIPIVFVTTYDDPAILERAKPTNPEGFIQMPFKSREIERTIEIALHQREIKEKLKSSTERLNNTQKIFHPGNWEWNIVTNELHWSDEIYRMFGLTPQQFSATYDAFLDMVHPDDREFVKQSVNDAVYNKKTYSINHQIILPDGIIRSVHEQGNVFFDSDNKPLRMIGTIEDITDHSQNEELILRFGKIPDNSSNEIYTFDANSLKFIQVNNEALENIGYSMKELAEMTTLDLKPGYSKESFEALVKPLRTGKTDRISFETVHKRKDGTQYPVEVNLQIFANESTPTFVEIIVDVTDRKLVEEKLRKNEANLVALVENTDDKIWSVDKEYNLSTFNSALKNVLKQVLGVELRKGLNIIDCNPPEERANWLKYYERALKGEKFSVEINYKLNNLDVYDEISFNPIYNNGQVEGVSCVSRNITERKEFEKGLQESEERFRSLYENAVEGIFQSSLEGKFLTANPALARMYGYDSPEELIKSVTDINRLFYVDPGRRKKLIELLNEKRIISDFESRVYRKDGSIIWISENTRSLTDEHGKIIGFEGTIIDITERKKAEEALRKSEDNYRDLVEHSNDLICTHDLEGNIISTNPAATRLVGYPIEKILTMNLKDFLVPEYRDGFNDYLEELKNKGSAKGIMVVKTSTGERRVWEYDNTLRKEGIDKPIIRGMARDITDRLTYEEQLRKLKRAVEQSPSSIIITDTKGNIEYVNAKCCSLSGYTKEELIGKTPAILKSGNTNKDVYRKLWDTINAGGEWRGELSNKRKDGSIYCVYGSISPIKNDRGKITHFLEFGEDITDRKQVEKKLSESEERFRNLYENARIGIYQTTPDGKILLANPSFIEMLEYNSIDELKNLDLEKDLYYEQSFHTRKQFIEIIEREGFVKGLEESWKTRTGKIIFVRKNARCVRDQDDKVLYYEGIVEDITQNKIAEKALIDAKEKAEEMNRLKSSILANMSHELRTPLIGILGYADMIAAEADNPELKEMAEVVKDSGIRLNETLNCILDLSRIESEQIEKNFEKISINDFLIDCKNSFEKAASSKGLWINIVTDTKPIDVVLDRNLLKKITDNILSNAIKYTCKGGIVIKAKYHKDKCNVEFAFIDTGVGISKKNLELIFDPFRQVSEGLNREFEGTGLGLTVTKKLVELLGGTISVESQLGKGSTFKIELPCNGHVNKEDNLAVAGQKNDSEVKVRSK